MTAQRKGWPQPWPGTPEEAAANYRSHRWTGLHDPVCFVCEAKPWHVAADWPCGVEPPLLPAAIIVASCRVMDEQAEASEREPGGIL
jgi:hypothetical protein